MQGDTATLEDNRVAVVKQQGCVQPVILSQRNYPRGRALLPVAVAKGASTAAKRVL